MYLQSIKSVKQNAANSVNRSTERKAPTYRVLFLYSSFVHDPGPRSEIKRDHWFSSALSLTGRVHIGARALLDMNLIWFGFIARLSQWIVSNDFYLPSLRLEGGGGSASCGPTISTHWCEETLKIGRIFRVWRSLLTSHIIRGQSWHLGMAQYRKEIWSPSTSIHIFFLICTHIV
jgi:hypothetical protein